MNKWAKTILRTGAFLLSTAISVSLLGWFSFWAWVQLNPMQQETIATSNTRWDVGLERRTLASSRHVGTDSDGPIDATEVASAARVR
jgi:hypothetical protein